ncbi:exodeoxyribonuclease VII large subunit [Opitutus sp. GAS368]|jgi:exodeoxyribonuclease VII large subunit|uniref:exodeoxyribonuclease VII large subunit n=1 Tax=Opitutus sp. GAS368 TaxID=1882749 RepID=UPI000879689D|nr:exodeoxyribonuclease VII large subunit [Opitutus sp. GAS368]SDS09347.1 Exodeoxyribonuclease VII large subunit [Opitutus sp. GAS368]
MAKKEPELPLEDAGRVASVTEFTRRVKELLEGGLPPCWVRGEVSNLRAQASGHVYFSLKDAGAQLSCVLFRGDAARQSLALRDGLAVLAYGEVSVYEARGQYQLVVRALIDRGAGRLQQELEKLKQRLAAEGVFDPARKQPIPLLPRAVGFITSPTGAAVQDFIRILTRRDWTGRLVVLPARVQGEGAAAELAAMLRTAEALKIFDLLVIGRGGGSIEDLWAFNEEPLVRAVADCGVPIISAVGHEIDTTLCDYAADVRAETPSGAAELISSNYVAATERLQQATAGLVDSLAGAVAQAAEKLDHARSRLRLLAPTAVIEHNHLRLDDLGNRLGSALRASVQLRREALGTARARLATASPEKRVQLESHRLLGLWKRLESASPASVLKRGYAIVRDEAGKPVARAKGLKPGQALVNEFHDGKLRVRVE